MVVSDPDVVSTRDIISSALDGLNWYLGDRFGGPNGSINSTGRASPNDAFTNGLLRVDTETSFRSGCFTSLLDHRLNTLGAPLKQHTLKGTLSAWGDGI